jgi:fructose-1,6-bisphosphatase/inositol monophosphatase family enzyme
MSPGDYLSSPAAPRRRGRADATLSRPDRDDDKGGGDYDGHRRAIATPRRAHRAAIAKVSPTGIRSGEHGTSAASRLRVIDPVDGTRSFIRQLH